MSIQAGFPSRTQIVDELAARVQEATQSVREFVQSHAPRRDELRIATRLLMSPVVHTCNPSDSLNRAAQLLWEGNCGSLPVIGSDGALLGMLTDRDICMAAYTQGRTLAETTVESAMSREVYACGVDEPLARALSIMSEKQVRRLPIVSSAGQLVGLLAIADVARWASSLPSHHVAVAALTDTVGAISEERRVEASELGTA